MQDILFKSNSGQFNIDEAQGIVECFVAGIGNKDSVGDIVVTGAFAKSLMRRKPRVVWGHNWNDPIGKVLEIYEVPPNDPRLPQKMKIAGIGGLYAKVQFNLNSEKGREAFTNVAFFGEEQEWSIGYKTLDAIYDNSKQANVLREVELYELSPVLHGANQLTGTISVKSDEKNHEMPAVGVMILEEKPKQPSDPFLQGVAQPINGDKLIALQNELAARTNGPVKIMKATESSVTFLKPGKGMFRLGYYFDGEQYMFGKPEKIVTPMLINRPMAGMPSSGRPTPGQQATPRIPNFPGVAQKPSRPEGPIIPVRYGNSGIQSGFFDSSKSEEESLESIFLSKVSAAEHNEITQKLLDITTSLNELLDTKSHDVDVWVIPCSPEDAFSTKQALDPVFDYHRIESYVTEDGIVISSPLIGDAYEAVENATKSLLGRIGRGIGGGGKVRRGRAALARIEGVLDPRKRRDLDGDGMIFDGTWREMPDPTRFATQGLRSETKPPADNTPPKKPKWQGGEPWYITAQRKGRTIVPFLIPRKTKPKIERMFEDFLKEDGASLPDDHIVRRIAKAIKEAKRYTELTPEVNEFGAPTGLTRPKQTQDHLPDIDEKMLEELRAAWPQVKDGLEKSGKHQQKERKMEKGRTPFEVLNELIEKGEYFRTNKQTKNTLTLEQGEARDRELDEQDSPIGRLTQRGERIRKIRSDSEKAKQRLQRGVDTRGGKVSAARGKEVGTPWPRDKDGKGIQHSPFEVRGNPPEIVYEKKIDGEKVDLLEPYIKAEIFPKNWKEMDVDEQLAWFGDNRKKLETLNRSSRWQKSIRSLDDYLIEQTMRKDEDRERDEAKKVRAIKPTEPEPSTQDTPKPKPKPTAPKTPPTKLRTEEREIKAWAETVSLGSKMNGVDEEFGNAVRDIADKIVSTVYPEDGVEPTPQNFKDAIEELDNGLAELAESLVEYDPIKEVRQTRKMTKKEKELLEFMYRVNQNLERGQGRARDSEDELDAENVESAGGGGFSTEAGEELRRRGRRAERYGLDDDDDDISAGANIDEIYGDDGTGDLTEFDEETALDSISGLESSTAKARAFQKSNRRKKQARGLASSTEKAPRTEITNESTWWRKIDDSLSKEIRSADSDSTKKGLTILQEKIKKYEAGAFTAGSKRTNVGSIKITADEADKILDAVMAVIDRQKTAGKDGGVGTRGEIFAELLEKVASAAMSTFVDKSSMPADK